MQRCGGLLYSPHAVDHVGLDGFFVACGAKGIAFMQELGGRLERALSLRFSKLPGR